MRVLICFGPLPISYDPAEKFTFIQLPDKQLEAPSENNSIRSLHLGFY